MAGVPQQSLLLRQVISPQRVVLYERECYCEGGAQHPSVGSSEMTSFLPLLMRRVVWAAAVIVGSQQRQLLSEPLLFRCFLK